MPSLSGQPKIASSILTASILHITTLLSPSSRNMSTLSHYHWWILVNVHCALILSHLSFFCILLKGAWSFCNVFKSGLKQQFSELSEGLFVKVFLWILAAFSLILSRGHFQKNVCLLISLIIINDLSIYQVINSRNEPTLCLQMTGCLADDLLTFL